MGTRYSAMILVCVSTRPCEGPRVLSDTSKYLVLLVLLVPQDQLAEEHIAGTRQYPRAGG